MLKDLLDGILNYFKVFRTANQYGLWRYLYLTGFISILLGSLIFYSAFAFGDELGKGLFSWYKWDLGQEFIAAIDDWVGGIIIGIFSIAIFKYLVIIISAPLMSFLSEQLERQKEGIPKHQTFSFVQAFGDFKRGIVLNLRNLLREILIVGLILILGLFPLFTLFAAPLIFLVQAFYAGFGNLDYFLERHYKVSGAVKFAKRHRFLAIGNGIIFLLLLMIPILGWFLAPFFSTIAGTLAAIERLEPAS